MDPRPAIRTPRLPARLDRPDSVLRPGQTLLDLDEAAVTWDTEALVAARAVRVSGCRLDGLRIEPGELEELAVADAVLTGGDLSNVGVRGGSLRRVELRRVRAVGLRIEEGVLQDVRIADGTLMLGSLARSGLERVVLEDMDLREVSFADARMRHVTIDGCDLAGADLRGARMRDCTIRRSLLDGVLGIDALRGVSMPWPDVVASAATFAAALGIVVEGDDERDPGPV